MGPFLSPDGEQLGFFRANQMLVVPVVGGSTVAVKGATVMAEGSPSWTSDGRIIYTNDRGGLVLIAVDGSMVDTLTRPVAPERHLSPIVLRGGRTVVYMVTGSDVGDSRIDALTVDTRQTKTLVSGGVMTPQYADGFLFFARNEGADATLSAVRFDEQKAEVQGDPNALGDQVNRSRFGTADYEWRRRMLYHPRSRTVRRGGPEPEQHLAHRRERQLAYPRYAPDGSRIVWISRRPGAAMWGLRSRVETSGVTRIGDAHDPVWLPNGRRCRSLRSS